MEKMNDFFILHPCLIMEKEEEKKNKNGIFTLTSAGNIIASSCLATTA